MTLVLFGRWSAQAITQLSYLSFSADGLHGAITHGCYLSFSADGLLRRFVVLVLFGGWSVQAITL